MKKERGKGRFSRVISIIAFLCLLYNNIQCISEYYVSPTETTDGDCSSSTPCSLSYAISEASVNAETTITYIYIYPGHYQQNNNIIIKNFKDITISAQVKNNQFDLAYFWTSSSNSSVFSVESSSITLENLTFNSSISTPLLVDENSYVIINYCVFENNTANSNSIGGGAIYSLSPLIISSSTFSNNYIGIEKSIYIASTKTYSPIALKGGAIFGNASINIIDTFFVGNYICGSLGEAYGGAIYGGYLVRLQHCDFEQNSIEGEINTAYGGAICSENSFLTILNSSFVVNQLVIYIYSNADEYPILLGMGGSVYAKGKISMEFTEISQSSINIYNYYGFARAEGGAVYSEDQISISDSSFKSNYLDIDCSESKDKEHHNAMGYGAVVSSSSHVKMEIIRSTFIQNTLWIRAFASEPRYVDADGGALQFYFGEIINSTFKENIVEGFIDVLASGSSLTGGAIGSSIVNIENCLFQKNSANSTGGAVQIWNNSNETSTIINTNFILNSAFGIEKNNGGGGRGGAIASVDDHNNTDTILLSLQYCSFNDNFAVNGADVYLQNIGYEIVDSGSVNIQTVDSVFYNPSTSVSKSPSFSITPSASPSYSRAINNTINDSNLIIVMSVSSILGVFVVVVLIAVVIAAISIFKIRQQNKKVTRRMIGDDNYVDDHEL